MSSSLSLASIAGLSPLALLISLLPVASAMSNGLRSHQHTDRPGFDDLPTGGGLELPEMGQLFLDLCILCSDIALAASFVAIAVKLSKTGSASGLSLQTVFALVSARSLHCCSHPLGMHFRPKVVPGMAYLVLDLLNVVGGLACLGMLFSQYYHTYERKKDNLGLIQLLEKFGLVPSTQENACDSPAKAKKRTIVVLLSLYLVVGCAALFYYLFRESSLSFGAGYFLSFYEVLSAFALVPQLWMFQQDKKVSQLLANFVVLTAANRLCTLMFWSFFPWVNIGIYPAQRTTQMMCECVNLLILSDFLFYWLRSKARGESVIIIGGELDV